MSMLVRAFRRNASRRGRALVGLTIRSAARGVKCVRHDLPRLDDQPEAAALEILRGEVEAEDVGRPAVHDHHLPVVPHHVIVGAADRDDDIDGAPGALDRLQERGDASSDCVISFMRSSLQRGAVPLREIRGVCVGAVDKTA